jgi:aminoglycoside 3-N-acetyltransferase
MPVTRVDLLDGLRDLGLHAGMGVMVHSSLKSFGYLAGGPITFIETLQETITPEGTILMPSFNHGVPFHEDGSGYYDPLETPTSNGAIPDTFWRMPEVRRSLNPTHPFSAWGKQARRYTEFHHRTLTMGQDSPLGLLHADGGYGLLVGVDYRTNTFYHVVEMTVGARCLGRRTTAYPVRLADGRMVVGRSWGWRADHCPITDGQKYGPLMKSQGLQKSVIIGQSICTLFQLSDCFELLSGMLTNGYQGFPPCTSCPIRPRQGAHTVESDWDDNAGCLYPDSLAWGY